MATSLLEAAASGWFPGIPADRPFRRRRLACNLDFPFMTTPNPALFHTFSLPSVLPYGKIMHYSKEAALTYWRLNEGSGNSIAHKSYIETLTTLHRHDIEKLKAKIHELESGEELKRALEDRNALITQLEASEAKSEAKVADLEKALALEKQASNDTIRNLSTDLVQARRERAEAIGEMRSRGEAIANLSAQLEQARKGREESRGKKLEEIRAERDEARETVDILRKNSGDRAQTLLAKLEKAQREREELKAALFQMQEAAKDLTAQLAESEASLKFCRAGLNEAKEAAGYHANVSFDDVWAEALAAVIEKRGPLPARLDDSRLKR